ncbi:sensor histidine kinase [Flavihumibacter petaseus]|uniref:histidine kinase n=1 Tax=Flavihumibacter petaseus NBRC 106054 TaxID=1220578 RepID=A0A0E9N0R5_9BACT|nr:sensor histidine kinase [Flavihumibacter petaseus]GAO42950.1 putative two-component histidine kinase [Flavihumibacter petaseus NBRC 106054]
MKRVSEFEIIYTLSAAVIMMLALSGFILYFILSGQRRRLKQKIEQDLLKQSYEKEVLTTQIESRDQTLRDVSQEIHDNMGQILSVARINLNILENELKDHSQLKRIQDTNNLVGDVIRYIRMLSKGMNSDMLSSYGLRESIRFELQRIEQSAMITCRFITEGEDFVIDAKKEIVIYRMIQEILNNILKHAAASEIDLSMIYTADNFCITIMDNGKGFDPREAEKRSISESGSGLKNLQKRAALVGARITINSVPGTGTSITINLPKNNEDAIQDTKKI